MRIKGTDIVLELLATQLESFHAARKVEHTTFEGADFVDQRIHLPKSRTHA